jgi:hypothetical protein
MVWRTPKTTPMKNILRSSLVAAALLLAASAFAATTPAPGYVDFTSFVPNSAGQTVEVKIDSGLLKFAAKVAARQEPAAAELLARMRHVRVNVVELDESNLAAARAKVAEVRRELEARGWSPTVNVRDPASGQDVVVYIKAAGEDVIEGIVVTVIDADKQAVFVNVVGDIRPEQLNALGNRFEMQALAGIDLTATKLVRHDR